MRRIMLPAILLLTVAVLSAPVAAHDKTCPSRTCPVCARPVQADWRYCPNDGIPLPVPLPVADDRSPSDVLHLFAVSYSKRDREGIARSLDFEAILSNLMTKGIDSMDLDPPVRTILKRHFVDRAARALAPVVLDAMVEEDMQTEWRMLSEQLSSKSTIETLFDERITGNEARLVPSQLISGAGGPRAIQFRRKDGMWKIVSFPQLGF